MATETSLKKTPAGEKVTRGLLSAFGGVIGFYIGIWLLQRGTLSGPSDEYLIGLVGVLTTFLATKRLARRLGRSWDRMIIALADIPANVVFAAGVGATAGLLITLLVSNVLSQIPAFTWYYSLLIAVVLVIGTAGFFVKNRHMFPFIPATDGSANGVTPEVNAKVLDSSALIDGRIMELAEAHFVQGKLVVPTFVLTELQHIADSGDSLRRQRGRRALEIVDKLSAHQTLEFAIIDADKNGVPVDEALVKLCRDMGADLVTTDYNLDKIAAVQGVTTLNLNRLATAMKPNLIPGERVMLHITKPGREPGQGLAYLEDGTMVVVEDTADKIGEDVQSVITSNIQTNVGRMIFAKPVAADEA